MSGISTRKIDDYRDDMSGTEFVDQDVERLLSGGVPRDPDLAELTSFIRALGSYRTVVPSIDAQEHTVATVAEFVRSGQKAHQDLVPWGAGVRPDRRPSLLPTRAVIAVGAFVLLVGISAVALAAHISIPGDTLYGLDRMLEAVGIGDGSVDERLLEADTLVAGGDEIEAITLLGETIERETVSGNAKGALVAERHLEEVAAHTASRRFERVKAFIATNKGEGIGLDGEDFSQGLRSLLRSGS